jgi:hypothetical protein
VLVGYRSVTAPLRNALSVALTILCATACADIVAFPDVPSEEAHDANTPGKGNEPHEAAAIDDGSAVDEKAGESSSGSVVDSGGMTGTNCMACTADQACQDGSCVAACGPSTCPQGCCDANGACVTTLNDSSCGTHGAACRSCSTGNHCVSGQCGCRDSTDCPANQACQPDHLCANLCGSNVTCNGGCCADTDLCVKGDASSACGVSGGACLDCTQSSAGSVCQTNGSCGSCVPGTSTVCNASACNASRVTCTPSGTMAACPAPSNPTWNGIAVGGACTVGTGACAGSGQVVCSGTSAATCNATAGSPQTGWFTAAAPNGSWDYNCDGTVELQYTDLNGVCAADTYAADCPSVCFEDCECQGTASGGYSCGLEECIAYQTTGSVTAGLAANPACGASFTKTDSICEGGGTGGVTTLFQGCE